MHTDTYIIHDSPYSFPRKLLLKLRKIVASHYRPKLNQQISEKLKNKEFTIFCNNCLGGVFYHDAGRSFTSPTVNLAFDGPDFIRFLERPEYYLSLEPVFLEISGKTFPVALFDDVEVNFVHYRTNEEARAAWFRRKERIFWENLFVIATDHDGMYLPEMLERFDKLPYQNKLMFTAKHYPQYHWAVQVPQFKHRNNVRVMAAFANMRGQRYYETCFDIAGWIASRCIDIQRDC